MSAPNVIKLELNQADILMMLPERMKEAAVEALLQQAHVMAGLAQIYVPVDTGSLRDSIRVERGGEGQFWSQVKVRCGSYIVNPKTGRLVDYAAFVEAKQPFMAPAWAEVEPTIVDAIWTRVESAITK
jgi:hypothetical protein